ncbi:MAG: NAD(P)/FAD-dependent oxidoreductase, partial [Acidaminobacteraceae bacterium]
VLGSKMFESFAEELDIPFKRIGSLVCAYNDKDIKILEELKQNGELLGVKGLRIVDRPELFKMEPNINKSVISALYAPSAAITEPWEVAIACVENAMDNGAKLKLNFLVDNIRKKDDYFEINSKTECIKSHYIVNAAGVYADRIYKMVNEKSEFSIHPRRGEYFLLDKSTNGYVKHIMFPCPSKLGKGILVLPTVNGNILIGPDSENLGDNQKEAKETVGERLDYVKEAGCKLIEKIPFGDNITTFSGLRAQPSTDDFLIGESEIIGFFNVAGIKSPGLSCAPAIGLHMTELVVKSFNKLTDGLKHIEKKENFNSTRKALRRFSELSDAERSVSIKENPLYGNIICRCELISEAEIVDSIHRNCGARSINGVKRRVRPGAGRCQGGFCSPRVVEILSRELSIKIEDVVYETKNSYILTGKTKSYIPEPEFV